MGDRATITITRGPDRGRVFDLEGEMMHLGAGPDNHIELSDPKVEAQQASIVQRNGRFAISTPLELTVAVEGNVIPAGRWVWLPEVARVQLTPTTSFQFNTKTPPASPVEVPEKPKPKPKPKQKTKSQQQVAKFVTDSGGDTRVTLGEDGHLPELRLSDIAHGKPKRAKQPGQASASIYVLVGFSVLASMVMVLVDSGSGGVSQSEVAKARKEIREYYAKAGDKVEPYQERLQEARHAAMRGDRRAEQIAYRRVYDLLISEDKDIRKGLTGSEQRDRKLRDLIGILTARRR